MTDKAKSERPERQVVTYKKEFNKDGSLKVSQNEMMDKAASDATKLGYTRTSVQTETPEEWTVLFFS